MCFVLLLLSNQEDRCKNMTMIYLSVTPVFRNGCGRFRRRRTGYPGNGHVAGSTAARGTTSTNKTNAAASTSTRAASTARSGVVVVATAAAARAAGRRSRITGCAAASTITDATAAATTAATARPTGSIGTGTRSSLSLSAFAQHRGP